MFVVKVSETRGANLSHEKIPFTAQLNVVDKMSGLSNKQIIRFYLKHLHTRLCKEDLQELSICLRACKVLNHRASSMGFVQRN